MEKSFETKTVFPFSLTTAEGQYSITVGLEDTLVANQNNLFIKYNYEPNGYCWEGHIAQILDKLNPELLKHIDFDSEAGAFYCRVDSEENMTKFANILSPEFSNLQKLEDWIKIADPSKIND